MTDLQEMLTFGPLLALNWHLACAQLLTAWCDMLLGE
jgi:hypothetical protein